MEERLARILGVAGCLLAVLLAFGRPVLAACPAGQSNPITSGQDGAGPPVIFAGFGRGVRASFFVPGAGDANNSGTLPATAWLVSLGDLDGDGLLEYRIDAPGEGAGGWGDPRAVGCPATLSPAHPPLVALIYQEKEDLDGDGKWDVWEPPTSPGFNDYDKDGRRTQPGDVDRTGSTGGCEGAYREDLNCDGRLNNGINAPLINEDKNGNGKCDFALGEKDLNGDGICGLVNEDRNFDSILDDRFFLLTNEDRNGNGVCDPGEDLNGDGICGRHDIFFDEHGQTNRLYPYGAIRPAPGGVIVASVAWNGAAYDFSAINTPTRLLMLADGRKFRVVDATPIERLTPRASGVRRLSFSSYRMHVALAGVDLTDDRGGTRGVFDAASITKTDVYRAYNETDLFRAAGGGASGGFIFLLSENHPAVVGARLRSAGSNAFLAGPGGLTEFVATNIIDSDGDCVPRPEDNCRTSPTDPNRISTSTGSETSATLPGIPRCPSMTPG